MPISDEPRSTATLEPGRLQLILDRLQSQFYLDGPASERIAAGVLTELRDLDQNHLALPR